MKRCWIKRIGKQGLINIKANKELKKIYQEKGIRSCELKFKGCLGSFTCGFAHKNKRSWYHGKPELLGSFEETILGCSNCHNIIENDKILTKKVFKKLRNN